MSPTLLHKLLLEHRYAARRYNAGHDPLGAIYPRDYYRPADLVWLRRQLAFTYGSLGETR